MPMFPFTIYKKTTGEIVNSGVANLLDDAMANVLPGTAMLSEEYSPEDYYINPGTLVPTVKTDLVIPDVAVSGAGPKLIASGLPQGTTAYFLDPADFIIDEEVPTWLTPVDTGSVAFYFTAPSDGQWDIFVHLPVPYRTPVTFTVTKT